MLGVFEFENMLLDHPGRIKLRINFLQETKPQKGDFLLAHGKHRAVMRLIRAGVIDFVPLIPRLVHQFGVADEHQKRRIRLADVEPVIVADGLRGNKDHADGSQIINGFKLPPVSLQPRGGRASNEAGEGR